MLQATRTANRTRAKKKQQAQLSAYDHHTNPQSRKSVRYGHKNKHHKGQTSPYTSKHNRLRNKRKSTVFRPTHAGQSVGAMVEHSVFAAINNPTMPNQAKYEQYKSMKRRESFTARKKHNDAVVRNTVLMNAQQHQQLLNMARSKPVTPAGPTALAAPTGAGAPPIDSWVLRAKTHRNQKGGLNINANAGTLIESKSRQQSAAVTPMGTTTLQRQQNVSARGASIGDALGVSPQEFEDYKQEMTSYKNPLQSNITTPDIRPQQYDNLPFTARKRRSLSMGNHATTTAPPQAYNVLNTMNALRPNQLFTTPNSRRPSVIQRQIPTNSAAPIASMIMMIFQSLPTQQKKDLMQLMSLHLMQQQQPQNVAKSQQGTPHLNPAVAAAMAAATQNANSLEQVKRHPLAASKSVPSSLDDEKRNYKVRTPKPPPKTSKSQTQLLKDRVNMNKESPQNTPSNEFNLFEIKEIKELSDQSHTLTNKKSSSSLSWKDIDNEPLPPTEPAIDNPLSSIPSQYDIDTINMLKAMDNAQTPLENAQTPMHDRTITPHSDLMDKYSDWDELSRSDRYVDNMMDPHLLDDHDMTDIPPVFIEPQPHLEKKQRTVRFKEPSPSPEPPPLMNQMSANSNMSSHIESEMKPLFEDDEDDNKYEIKQIQDTKHEVMADIPHTEDIAMTPLLQDLEDILDTTNAYKDTLDTEKTASMIDVPSSEALILSPKKQLLSGDFASAEPGESKDDLNDDDGSGSDIDPRSRMSSKELFLQDVMTALFPVEDGRSGHHQHDQSTSDSDGECSHNSSSKSESDEPRTYMARLHPSRYQLGKYGSGHDGSSAGSGTDTNRTDRTDTTHTTDRKTEENTQRLGLQIQSNAAAAAASMMDIGIDPDAEDGESDDDKPNYFGAGTPIAVKEGTETIQKTLRAVWVRGHTRIGTLIHFLLIVINLMAAVMFVAAIEDIENDSLEYFFTSAFLVDFCVRLYAAKSAIAYLHSAKGIADFISVMPGIILAVTEANLSLPLWTFSFVRAMRVLRILRLLTHMVNHEDYENEELEDPIDIDEFNPEDFLNELNIDEFEEIVKKKDKACCNKKFWVMSAVTYFKLTLVSYLLMVVFVGAGLFACVEGPQSEVQTVESFFESFYFIVCTVTTVGYGDLSPDTPMGQLCIILVICIAFIVVPYRASILAQLEFEYADQESEPSIMDFNMDALRGEEEEEEIEGPSSFLGYCANCAGPRWTIGTNEMPISCMHCFHPVLTPEQVSEWFPDIAEALGEFVTNEQNELLALMLDAKEGADNGLLPMFQQMVRGNIDPNANANANAYTNANNTHEFDATPSMNPGFVSLIGTPIGGLQQWNIDPRLLLEATFPNTNAAATHQQQHSLHQNIYAPSGTVTQEQQQMNKADMKFKAIKEEDSQIIMESPGNNSDNIEIKQFRVCVTPVPDDDIEEKTPPGVHLELVEYEVMEMAVMTPPTPSMEESETLGGFHDNISNNDNKERERERETPTPILTPISTVSTPASTHGGHFRRATPAEMPSVKPIKTFSMNLTETPLREDTEDIYDVDYRISQTTITPEPQDGDDDDDDNNGSSSYNDEIDDAMLDEMISNQPQLHAKSTGDILKKHILSAIRSNSVKKRRKMKRKMKGGSYNENYHYSSTPNDTASDIETDADYSDIIETNDDNGRRKKKKHIQQLSIIIDGRDNHNDVTMFDANGNDNDNDDNEYADDEITPQQYEQMKRFFDKYDAAKADTRRESKKKNKKQSKTQQQQRRLSKHKYKEHHKALASALAQEAATAHARSRLRTQTVQRYDSAHTTHTQQHPNHRSYKSEQHLNTSFNHHNDVDRDQNQDRNAFKQHQHMAKSMTNLFVAEAMNRKKGYNPMAEHITNKVYQNNEDKYGASVAAELMDALAPKVSTPILVSPVLAKYQNKKNTKSKSKKGLLNKKKKSKR